MPRHAIRISLGLFIKSTKTRNLRSNQPKSIVIWAALTCSWLAKWSPNLWPKITNQNLWFRCFCCNVIFNVTTLTFVSGTLSFSRQKHVWVMNFYNICTLICNNVWITISYAHHFRSSSFVCLNESNETRVKYIFACEPIVWHIPLDA